ncbi:dicarboxylate/amino acid:cation symporter [Lederbergia lenta]|uniref:C4-dicarboxylate transport protein n=1 Tax=Lederbergia lenta TaxID=1467 RepID=A0A2X4VQS8_LEDLE|nr:dicarboxylate/amino acid:cation symporter [Lederbergia lenta]MCM3112294.1 dicarboxylate/amino acid:cation symporter [Lederbergia lenta]MEC2326514.1 dicarboxylate/amino acid:cation symporter [Lederbergia lenta]SQI53241.1 C4-dicarboxylate transport protein [Lederbergia lenta]
MKKIGLLPKIIIAIILGIVIGMIAPDKLVRVFATFNGLFGNFLGFVIPLIIIGFIAPGIGALGRGAGKLLGWTAALAYISTIGAGLLAFLTAKTLYPSLLSNLSLAQFADPEKSLAKAYFLVEMPPLMDVMSALLIAFIIGIGIAAIKSNALLSIVNDFRDIVQLLIEKVIIPLLPFHIFGIFANMTSAGQVGAILSVFSKVFIMIIALHLLYLLLQFTVAGSMQQRNPLKMLKTMSPAYFTALGTQSSAATIPVTLKNAKKIIKQERVAEFATPLLATIHLSGSTITLVSCAMAVMFMQGQTYTFGSLFPFILMLGITMVAAPGVPGGAVMAALGLLESMLGFGPTMTALMIALYMAQDSFGTACNVTGDGAITAIVDRISKNDSAQAPNTN